jgi:hypothetical protein
VLVKGDAIQAPAGRSDDFKWPRRGIAPFGTDPAVATTSDPIVVEKPALPPVATVEEPKPAEAAPPRRSTRRQAQQPQNGRSPYRER